MTIVIFWGVAELHSTPPGRESDPFSFPDDAPIKSGAYTENPTLGRFLGQSGYEHDFKSN